MIDHRGFVSAPNTALEVNAALARSTGLAGLRWAYPPVPTFLASVVPGGPLGLALVSSILAGVAMASLWHRLVQRRVPLALSILLLASLAAVPAAIYGATQDIAAFAGLAFLILALDGFVRFIVDRETRGGFQAGMMLALSFGCDPVALVYAAALAGAAPLLARTRYREDPGAAVATASVLLFPVGAAAAAWAFLEWRFTGAVFATVRHNGTFVHFPDGVVRGLGIALRDTATTALHVPVYVAVGALLFARKRIAVAGYALPLAGLVFAQWVGLTYTNTTAFMLLAAIAILTVPARPSRNTVRVLAAAGALQIGLGLWATSHSPEVQQFLHALV